MTKLNQRVGIDRTTLFNFDVKRVFADKMNACRGVVGRYASITYDSNSPIVLEDGKRIGKLIVKDSRFGKLSVSVEKNNLDGTQIQNTKLELTVSEGQKNLQNLSASEYQQRIAQVFQILSDEYGIIADYSSIRLKQVELNATFYLDEPYEKYEKAILMIVRNVPVKRYGNGSNNAIKYATWREARKHSKDVLETALVKNSSTELKIYNKKKQQVDIGEANEESSLEAMRIEYKIKDRRIIEKYFGDNLVSSLTDDKMKKLFFKYFQRDVVTQYYEWVAVNRKQLSDLYQKHRALTTHWISPFYRECRQLEAENGLPTLFDVKDMEQVIALHEPKTVRRAKKRYNTLLDNADYEADLIGNTSRIKEIISKVLKME